MASAKKMLRDRSVVRRKHAVTHLLITLLCFAFSVTATRVFLELTGYPQLGGGELHIAHVLWGGLFLFLACLLPLIWVNQWILNLSALISGLGVGLFIDEVGKFITSSNNYFFPAAAPIIYAFFLLIVLTFIQVKHKRKPSSREVMYGILEDFAEVLDHDLSKIEYDHLMSDLNAIIHQQNDLQMVNLAKSLQEFLKNKQTSLVEHEPNILERIGKTWQNFTERWLTKPKLRLGIIIGLLLWSGWAITSQTIMYMTTHDAQQLKLLIEHLIANQLIRNDSGMNWFETQILLEGAMGILSFIAALLLLFKKDRVAVWIGIIDMVFTLVVVNLLTFYFDQFSTIAFAAVQFFLLIFLLYYKRRFLDKKINP